MRGRQCPIEDACTSFEATTRLHPPRRRAEAAPQEPRVRQDRKAHRGEVVETPEREVDIYRAELLKSDAESAEYEIECSTGTYIRTLVETLDDAYCLELRRTAIGPFSVEDAGDELPLERIAELVPAAAEALR